MAYPEIKTREARQWIMAKMASAGVFNLSGVAGACLTAVAFTTLTACSGPNEKAGGEQDKSAAAAQGQPYSGDGPNERIGRAQDRAAAAEQNVQDAAADALKAQGQNLERQADVAATRLDERSRAIREAADKQADELDKKADAARK